MSLTSIFPWWTWLFGGLGLAGIVALAVLAPAAAVVAEQGIAAMLQRLLRTRIGVGIVVGIAALFLGHIHGAVYADRQCDGRLESQRQAAAAAAVKRDATIAAAAEKKYAPVLEDLNARSASMQQEIAAYDQKLLAAMSAPGAAPAGRCVLGAEPLRLRNRSK